MSWSFTVSLVVVDGLNVLVRILSLPLPLPLPLALALALSLSLSLVRQPLIQPIDIDMSGFSGVLHRFAF